MRKLFTLSVLTACLFVSDEKICAAGMEIDATENGKISYIVVCDEAVERQIAEKYPDMEMEELNDEDISKIDAGENEVQILEKEYGEDIIIEEDIILKASSKKRYCRKRGDVGRGDDTTWNIKMINAEKRQNTFLTKR